MRVTVTLRTLAASQMSRRYPTLAAAVHDVEARRRSGQDVALDVSGLVVRADGTIREQQVVPFNPDPQAYVWGELPVVSRYFATYVEALRILAEEPEFEEAATQDLVAAYSRDRSLHPARYPVGYAPESQAAPNEDLPAATWRIRASVKGEGDYWTGVHQDDQGRVWVGVSNVNNTSDIYLLDLDAKEAMKFAGPFLTVPYFATGFRVHGDRVYVFGSKRGLGENDDTLDLFREPFARYSAPNRSVELAEASVVLNVEDRARVFIQDSETWELRVEQLTTEGLERIASTREFREDVALEVNSAGDLICKTESAIKILSGATLEVLTSLPLPDRLQTPPNLFVDQDDFIFAITRAGENPAARFPVVTVLSPDGQVVGQYKGHEMWICVGMVGGGLLVEPAGGGTLAFVPVAVATGNEVLQDN